MNSAVEPIKREAYQTDLLTLGQKITLASRLPVTKGAFYLIVSITAIVIPFSLMVSAPILLWMTLLSKRLTFPARMPRTMNKRDPSDPIPGRKKLYHKARGEFFLGNHRGTGREIWASWDDVMTHIYMIAATGGGKSEAIWAMILNFLCCGSGFTMGDGKGTLDMVQQGRTMARMFGLEDNYYVVNYISSSSEFDYKLMSNTINTFNDGNAAQLKERLASLSLSGDAGQNQFFEDGADNILVRLFPALVELRDKGIVNMDFRTIGTYFPLHRLYELSQNENVSLLSRSYLASYLETTGFDPTKGRQQAPDITKAHGQFISHFSKAISSMSIQYRDISLTDQGDINMRDIISNRRNLIFALPALEKSGSELKNLGKVLLTAQKAALAMDIGDVLEGNPAETTLRLSKNYTVPYALVYDEWSFYAIEDMALIPAQVRGIRHSAIYCAQDYGGTERAGELDAESVFANCRIKFFGALEEAGKSWTRIRDLVGEVRKAVNNNYKYLPGILGGRFIIDRERTEITHRSEIEIADLQRQISGEFYMFMRSKLSPVSFLYAALDSRMKAAAKGNDFKINRFVKVYAPSEDALSRVDAAESFMDLMYGKDKLFSTPGLLTSLKTSLKDNAGNTALALKEFVSAHSDKLGVMPDPDTEDGTAQPDDDASLLQAFFLPGEDNKPESGTASLPTIGADPLLAQTIEAKQAIIQSPDPLPGATILSDRQTQEMLEDMTEINQLLGMTTDASKMLAKLTIQKIGKQCYYLAPPRPSPLQREAVADLKKRVDDILS